MRWDQIEGRWSHFRAQVQGRWAELTDSDLEAIAGRRELLEARLQNRYGWTRERVRSEIAAFLAVCTPQISIVFPDHPHHQRTADPDGVQLLREPGAQPDRHADPSRSG